MKISKIFVSALLCVMMSASLAQAKTYLNTGRLHDVNDFEGFNMGIISKGGSEDKSIRDEFGAISDTWSIETTQANLTAAIDETADKDGNPTKALHFYVDGMSSGRDHHVILQPRPDANWTAQTRGKYFVYKLDFKSGGDGCGYFSGGDMNINDYATVDWATGKAGWGYSANETAFALDEWVTFMFIVDKTGSTDVGYMRFESSLGTKVLSKALGNFEVKNSQPRWLGNGGWIKGGSSKPENPSLYFDNIEYYVTDYNVTCRNNGLAGVDVENKIELLIDGDIDEKSLETISVTASDGAVQIESIDYSDGVCTLNLAEKMKEFTKYTVDISGVCGEMGLSKSLSPIEFTTTGQIALNAEVTAEKISANSAITVSALEKGLVQVTFNVENTTPEKAENAVLTARLVKDGKTEAMSYKTLNLKPFDTTKMVCAFAVPDDECAIELFAKNSLNGMIYYTDIYKVDKNGISSTPAEETEIKYPVVNAASAPENSASFYGLTLGENASRTELGTLTAGLTECAANITESGEAMLITTLKKDGAIKSMVYQKRENTEDLMYTAINVPDGTGYTLDSFVWDGLLGTKGYIEKTTISSDAEEK